MTQTPVLERTKIICTGLGLPFQTGLYTNSPAPDTYVVATPLVDILELFADNQPGIEIEEVRLSLFTKTNYLKQRAQLTTALLAEGLTVTGRRYVGFEDDTDYHHYAIDVASHHLYSLEGN